MRTRIKFCGIRTLQTALDAIKLGVDALGFIMSESPRRAEPEVVRDIISHLPPMVTTIGVFVNEPVSYIDKISEYRKFDIVQLQKSWISNCTINLNIPIIIVYRVALGTDNLSFHIDSKACAYLFDSYDSHLQGGSGKCFDWKVLSKQNVDKPIILAGGLNASNIAQAVSIVRPYAVDVSSGIETAPGIKDINLMRAFVENVRNADMDIY
ncbi:phosphoribosylanthranilate isomerase [Sporomusa sphaeroides]|uniref:N-(5'-phosphoribosyl)anthranilate isomerase n=1 Tax=Sporomusa sphaeroides DSM 2875 TaxID=1337886 RepID=A0ABP2C3W9_9FIRM|nr:phosphoribosylanthranilate isomerase [Sporomusa sphaeroides]OLS56221.1 N-(5'-phosphoribosyl)anthranilate isomerase [Sporomusa sphaeroides DSM 2875]CVK19137.1 N-(5'-phosphoribosyl)anthranilate isomerase [Sporomusa sphaeroides DSM 2875]